MGGSGLLIWRIGADGKLAKLATLSTGVPGFLHAFAMTHRYLVFMFIPYVERSPDGTFFERLRFAPEKPCRIAVVPKDSLDTPRWYETDFCMAYHFAGAFERGDEIVVRAVQHFDLEWARSPMRAVMRGERNTSFAPTALVSLRLDRASHRARWEKHDVTDLEFPTFDVRSDGAARIYAPTSVSPNNAPYFNAICSIDAERNQSDVYRYGSDVMAEEHLFVPRPGSRRAGEGWLLGTLLDLQKGRSGIAVLNAERVADGPLAIAWLPYSVPLGFHGSFTSDA